MIGWVQHRWPNGVGYGHTTLFPCGPDSYPPCPGPEEAETTFHDAPPRLSWETDDEWHAKVVERLEEE